MTRRGRIAGSSRTPRGKVRSRGAGQRAAASAAMAKGTLFSPAKLTRSLAIQAGHTSREPSRFQRLLDSGEGPAVTSATDDLPETDATDYCILSQDFFCTPDYITPDGQQTSTGFELDKEDADCPKSPQKSTKASKRRREEESQEVDLDCNDLSSDQQQILQLEEAVLAEPCKAACTSPMTNKGSYVSQSAVALRCRVIPPPCITNPFSDESASADLDPYTNWKIKALGFSQHGVGADGLSRYHTDFHEIEQIGIGSFSRVFKVLKRIDGCLYAVKHSINPLQQDTDRRRALMEVQALAALGYHENIVGYHTSWFENEKLYIQLELCDHSLNADKFQVSSEGDILEVVYQVAKALMFIHGRGIAHLDVKPENIYVKNDMYKLGDFGFATLLNRTLPIEEGDARYMPLEILNDNYEHLDKVDIFSLGAVAYELLKGSPLPSSGAPFVKLREGKITLFPGYSMHFQNLLKAMMHPDPHRRPPAKEVIENSVFERIRRNSRS